MSPKYIHLIHEIKDHIDTSNGKVGNVSELAQEFNVSTKIVQEYFKYVFGISPKEYINDLRYDCLIQMLLQDGKENVNICFHYAMELGFLNGTSLNKLIKRKTGLTFKQLQGSLFDEVQMIELWEHNSLDLSA